MALLPALALLLGTTGGPLPAGCEPGKGEPQTLGSPAGLIEQRKLACTGAEVFLSSKAGKVSEVFVRAADDGAATALATELEDFLKQPPGAVELAYARFDGALKVTAMTLSLGSFSWDLLPGQTYEDKVKELARRNPEGVNLAAPIRVTLPGGGTGRVVVSTFVLGGAHAEGPGPSIVHVLGDDGKPLARLVGRFPGSFGELSGSFTPFAISGRETALKYASTYVGQGMKSERSFFYRLDVAGRQLAPLALQEGASNNLESPTCLERGECREIRYGLIPTTAPGKDSGGFFTFNVDRVEVRHKKKGAAVKTTEKVIGTCVYDEHIRDYRCPKLPADAGS